MATENTGAWSAAALAAENRYVEQQDPFWFPCKRIHAENWNKSFPYQLLVVERLPDGTYQNYQGEAKKWFFTLPIPPEALSVTTPFAISTLVTQGGIIEEHNGSPTKIIQLSGTTGVLPLRGVMPQQRLTEAESIASSIFGGTVSAFNRTASAARDLAGDFSSGNKNLKTGLVAEVDPNNPGDVGKTSGYYQFKMLERFLENYVNFKKTAAGRDFRLVFGMFKDKHMYLVTPIAFTVERRADRPLEYMYSLQLKAWRDVVVWTSGSAQIDAFSNLRTASVYTKPNAFARLLKAITDLRRIVSGLQDTLNAVVQDVRGNIFEPLRQIAFFAKDLLGVPLTIMDLPFNLVGSSRDLVTAWVSTIKDYSSFKDTADEHLKQDMEIIDSLNKAANLQDPLNKTPLNADAGGTLPRTAQTHTSDPFSEPDRHFSFFNNVRVGDLKVTPTLSKSIAAERDRVSALKRIDFEMMRNSLKQVAIDYAAAIGLGNATYSSTFSVPTRAALRAPTESDYDALFALHAVIMELNRMAASGQGINPSRLSTMEYVAGLARRSSIAFKVPQSKFAVPFPYGFTLERLAQLYLRDPDRWLEIANLNGLRAPYVDEEGFDLPLLVNGSGHTVNVADASSLCLGQQVWISSSATSRTVRRIAGLERVSDSQTIVTLDGDDDLARFTTVAGATLHAFLPDTVNSQMVIYIPSDDPPANVDFQSKQIPGVDQFDRLLAAGGVDVLLTPDNDLAITPDGDQRLAIGLANIVQSVRLRIATPRGTLFRHPGYGFPIQAGTSTADLSAQDILDSAEDLFSDDPSFTNVSGVSVAKNGPVASLSMAVSIAGVAENVPITVDIRR